ncbi:protein toll-like isoform X2 [Tachypleus tridentatus]|uniref:protein toll-like isoform X2 n=1 Tax=Tachypleus tridentatus TaxID=6853 RepID=UPI003FD643DD
MFLAWFVVVPFVCFASVKVKVSENQCPQLKNCTCQYQGQLLNVNCINITDTSQLTTILHEGLKNQTFNHVYISKSNISHIPSSLFANLTIQKIILRHVDVETVDPDAFETIQGLYELKLNYGKIKSIPIAISNVGMRLRSLWMEHGKIKEIRFEFQNFTILELLDLKANKIVSIHKDAFISFKNLRKLDLSQNAIKVLEPGTFREMHQLQQLFLGNSSLVCGDGLLDNMVDIEKVILVNNNLTNIDKLTSTKLFHVKELFLSNNPLQSLRKDTFEDKYVSLTWLRLDHTELRSVHKNTFQKMLFLHNLDISHNHIEEFDKTTFDNLPLVNINLYRNQLTTINGLSNMPLETLNAGDNKIRNIRGAFDKLPKLQYVLLTHNFIPCIEGQTFRNNEMLQHLIISRNKITWLASNAFEGLKKLKILILNHNFIQSLNGSLQYLPWLQVLDLFNNSLTHLNAFDFNVTQGLYKLKISSNKLVSVEGAFVNMKLLGALFIGANYLETLSRESFPEHLKNLWYIKLWGNPLACDCRLTWLLRWIRDTKKVMDRPRCFQPQWLKNRHFRHLKESDLLNWPDHCPEPCNCFCVSNNSDYFINVDCSGRQMSAIPTILPGKVGYLNVNNNSVQNLEDLDFCGRPQLQTLLLENNRITVVNNVSFPKNLKRLSLARNDIESFPLSTIEDLVLDNITLSDNPWLCLCKTLPFRNWLFSHRDVVSDINETYCSSSLENGPLRGNVLVSLTERDLCPQKVAMYIVITIGILALLLGVSGVKIIYSRYNMNIKIWMYTHHICTFLSCVKEDEIDEDKVFDAFICYNTLDESLVLNNILPGLEEQEPFYNLCIHERNFLAGSYIADNIVQAVKASRRIIVVLSENFVKSEWCRMEFKTAHLQVLEDRIHRLLVILLGDLPDEEDMDPEMNMYLKTVVYLKWGDKNFWNKLRYFMPKKVNVVPAERQPLLKD